VIKIDENNPGAILILPKLIKGVING